MTADLKISLTLCVLISTVLGAGARAQTISSGGTNDGVVRVGFAGPGAILDPHRQTQAGEGTYITLVFDRLTRIDADGKPSPMLAAQWQFLPDGTSLDLQLRDDVKFHDGTAFDASAVKANIERAKTVERSTVSGLLSEIESVEPLSQYKVRLHLAPHKGANLPYVLATNAGAMISPKALADPTRNLSLDPRDAGSGPFIVSKFKPNELVVYDRADGQTWDKGAGLAKRIEISFASNDARLRAFQTGALDVVQLTGAVNSLGRSIANANPEQYEVRIDQNGTTISLLLRSDRPPLDDVRFRRAIFGALDRDAISRVVTDGNCTVANQLFQPGHWANEPGFNDFQFDPEQSKKQIESMNATGKTFEILAGGGGLWDQSAVLIQSMLKEVGINATVATLPVGDSVNDFKSRNRDALVYSPAGEAHPAFWFDEVMLQGFSLMPKEQSADLSNIIDRAQDPTTDEPAQAMLYREAGRLVANAAVILPFCWVQQLYLSRKSVQNGDTLLLRVGASRDYRFLSLSNSFVR